MNKLYRNVLEEIICKPDANYFDSDLPSRVLDALLELVDVCEGDTHELECVLDDILKFQEYELAKD